MAPRSSLAFAALLLLPACGASSSGPTDVPVVAQPAIAQSGLARQTSPVVDPADAAALADGNTAFALDLHGLLRQSAAGKNLFYSPLSMSLALGMTYAGARGDTAAAMAKALHFTLPQEKLHPALNQLDLALASRGQGAKGADGLPFRLRVVDSLWGHRATTFVPGFLDTLATSYGAGVYLEDFVTAPEAARTDINAWVGVQTEKRIPELMPKGSVSSDVRFVIVNAVYFNAGWAEPFLPGATALKPFHGGDGSTADVPTMTGNYTHAAYGEGNGWKVVTLPYDGGEVACDIVLPDAGRFDEIEAAMTPTLLATVRSSQKARPGTLYLPKFEIKGETFSVRDSLTKLGMGQAFSDSADFSGITTTDHVSLFDVMHQAFVKVDEKGTEAAAATSVAGGTASAPVDPPFTMTVDRPFLFFVRDVATGTLLFVGRISSPVG